MLSNKKILGVIGGMGPYATLTFFEKFLRYNTQANCDQDHFPLYILNDPEIPDRTRSIIRNENLDVISKRLISNAQRLQHLGCHSLVMPCNTAHYFYDEIQDSVDIPIVSLVDETLREINSQRINSFGLLSTFGTVYTNTYNKSAYDFNIKIKTPCNNQQDRLSDVIYNIKSQNKPTEKFKEFQRNEIDKICDEMNQKYNINTFVLGCTELGFIYDDIQCKYDFIDPMDIVIENFYNST